MARLCFPFTSPKTLRLQPGAPDSSQQTSPGSPSSVVLLLIGSSVDFAKSSLAQKRPNSGSGAEPQSNVSAFCPFAGSWDGTSLQSHQTKGDTGEGRSAFDLQRAKLPRSRQERTCGTGLPICGHQQPAVLPSREAKQMGHLVTHWHQTEVVLFPRVHEGVRGAPAGPDGHAALGDHLSSALSCSVSSTILALHDTEGFCILWSDILLLFYVSRTKKPPRPTTFTRSSVLQQSIGFNCLKKEPNVCRDYFFSLLNSCPLTIY